MSKLSGIFQSLCFIQGKAKYDKKASQDTSSSASTDATIPKHDKRHELPPSQLSSASDKGEYLLERRKMRDTGRVSFDGLPIELKIMIFESLDDLKDIKAL